MPNLSSTGLFKFGNYEIPSTYIAEGGYDIKPNQRQDLDPFTDQTGVTHRNALSHTKTEVTITLREGLSWNQVNGMLQQIRQNYIRWAERDATCYYYDPETGSEKSGHMYLESSQGYQIKTFKKKYPSMSLTFVEY